MTSPLNIGITCGDCNGIGLEVFLKALSQLGTFRFAVHWHLLVNPSTLYSTVTKLSLQQSISYMPSFPDFTIGSHTVLIHPIEPEVYPQFGTPTVESAQLAYNALQEATRMLRQHTLDALVTLPVHKRSLQTVGFTAPGQTDWFAQQFDVTNYLMIFWSPALLLALATIHIPLRAVADHLHPATLLSQLRLLHTTLCKDFNITNPTIAVLGLNPHAGEGGMLGEEESTVIKPAIQQAKEQGIDVTGPFSADAFFARNQYRNFTATMAMYHDQGLIPLKLLAQGRAVNITAGLPFIRTSPDHGTAYDIAGKGIADPTSCREALQQAVILSHHRRLHQGI